MYGGTNLTDDRYFSAYWIDIFPFRYINLNKCVRNMHVASTRAAAPAWLKSCMQKLTLEL